MGGMHIFNMFVLNKMRRNARVPRVAQTASPLH